MAVRTKAEQMFFLHRPGLLGSDHSYGEAVARGVRQQALWNPRYYDCGFVVTMSLSLCLEVFICRISYIYIIIEYY